MSRARSSRVMTAPVLPAAACDHGSRTDQRVPARRRRRYSNQDRVHHQDDAVRQLGQQAPACGASDGPPPFRDTVAARAEAWTRMIEAGGGELGSRHDGRSPGRWISGIWGGMVDQTDGANGRVQRAGFSVPVPAVDIRPDLPKIRCPTLVITTSSSGLGSVDETRA